MLNFIYAEISVDEDKNCPYEASVSSRKWRFLRRCWFQLSLPFSSLKFRRNNGIGCHRANSTIFFKRRRTTMKTDREKTKSFLFQLTEPHGTYQNDKKLLDSYQTFSSNLMWTSLPNNCFTRWGDLTNQPCWTSERIRKNTQETKIGINRYRAIKTISNLT